MYEKFNILAADLAETLVTEERFNPTYLADKALEDTVEFTPIFAQEGVGEPMSAGLGIPPRTDGTRPRAV